MRSYRRLAALLAAVLLMTLLSACGGTKPEDARTVVQGTLDKTFSGNCEKAYLKLTGIDADKAEADHRAAIAAEVKRFASYFDIEHLSDHDGMQAELETLFLGVYTRARYTVGTPEEREGGYTVNVSIQPMDLFELSLDDFNLVSDAYIDKYSQTDVSDIPEDEYEKFLVGCDATWARLVVDHVKSHFLEIGYLDGVNITVNVTESGGKLTLSETELYKLQDAILPYPDYTQSAAPEPEPEPEDTEPDEAEPTEPEDESQ